MVEISDTAKEIVKDLTSIVDSRDKFSAFFLVKAYFLGNKNEALRQMNNPKSIFVLKEQVLYGLEVEGVRREIIRRYIEKTAGFESHNID